MENPGLTISSCEVLNPALLLPTPEGSLTFHFCLETLGHRTKPKEGLSEDPLTNPEEIWYTDGSSFILDGKRRAELHYWLHYWIALLRLLAAVVSNFETIETKWLPPEVKVLGHDSWIHYSGVKLQKKKTKEDTQSTCELLGGLRYLLRTTNECHSKEHPKIKFLGIRCLRIALKSQHILAGVVLQNRQEIDLLIPEQGGTWMRHVVSG